MNDKVAIYMLYGPDGLARYIGRTRSDPDVRLAMHIAEAERTGKRADSDGKDRWISALLRDRQRPLIYVIEMTDSANADTRGREHVAAYLAAGYALTNRLHNPAWAAAQRADRAVQRSRRTMESLTVRLPADLAAALRRLALDHERSLNAEVVWGLRDYTQRMDAGKE